MTPDILEALKAAAGWMTAKGDHAGQCDGGRRCTCGLAAASLKIRRAIVKAESLAITVEPGIPIPRRGNRRGGKPVKYTQLRTMEVGESFFLADKIGNSMTGAFWWARPRKFKLRTVTENGVKGVRIWRIL